MKTKLFITKKRKVLILEKKVAGKKKIKSFFFPCVKLLKNCYILGSLQKKILIFKDYYFLW